ncbi:MAG: hypothetical protein J3Q66DRAFT_369660 [Benniella sp.]|nr:MAG: hypothetical protein J3Q66DRAFT_369660 [Benniella sp.]
MDCEGTKSLGAQTSQNNLQDLWFGIEELRQGYYTITWHVVPTNNGQLFDLVLEVETCSTKCKLWAKASKEEVESITCKDTSSGVRIPLQQKLHLEHYSKIAVRLSARLYPTSASSEHGSGFEVCSVELVRLGTETPGKDFDHNLLYMIRVLTASLVCAFRSLDYEVEAPGQIMRRPNDMTFGQMSPIFATDVSASGEHIAILSADHNNAYIHVVDIDDAIQTSASNVIRADYTIPLKEGQFDTMQLVKIAISSDGEHIALYQEPYEDSLPPEHSEPVSIRFPFHAFQLNCITTRDPQTASDSQSMKPVKDTAIQQLKDRFIGYGKFLARDGFQSGKKDFIERDHSAHGEYFVAINESRINVYDVGNGWKPLFGHNIGDLATMRSRTKQLQMLHQSISGPQFVWMEDAQNVSVWDLESGANTKYITVNNPDSSQQDIISYLAVSPGGKLLALAGKDWIRTYFMDSCIEICKTTIDNGTVLNIEFIDRDKSLLVTIGKPSMEQTSIIMDAMNLSSWQNHRREFPSSCYTSRRIARPSNGPQDGVMMAVNWNTLEVYDIPQPVPIDGLPVICQGTCTTNPHQELSYGPYRLVVDFDKRKNDDRHQKLARVCLWIVGSLHPIMTIIPEPWRFLDMNEVDSPIRASFLSPWPQFIITTSSGFQVWNLPQPDYDNQCELTLSWVMPRWRHTKINGCVENYVETIQETMVCSNGECATSTCIDKTTGKTRSERVNIPKSSWSTQSDTMHCINSFPVLASCYFHSSPAAQDAIIRYIVKHINHDPSEGAIKDSLMDMIAMSAKWKCCSDILGHILRSTDGKWIPRCTPTMKIRDGRQLDNPISFLLNNCKNDPYAFSMAKQMMDYCIREAKIRCDPAFLHPVSGCLPVLIDHHPDIAIDVTRRSSFIPIRNKRFVIDRALIAPPLLMMGFDWVVRRKRAIYKYQDPVFQLKSQLLAITPGDFTTHIEVTPEIISDPVNNERFEEKVYVAPYSLLWHYRDNTATLKYTNGIIGWIRAVVCWVINRIVDLALYIINWIMTMAPTRSNFICTVITVGCHAATMVVDTLNPLHKPTLRLNFRSRKYHHSPAVVALIRYKWYVNDTDSPGRKLTNPKTAYSFFSSPYNVVDVIGYLIPTLGYIQLLINIIKYDNTNVIGDSRLLSYGITLAYLHAGGDFGSISKYIRTSGDLTFLFVMAVYYAFMVFLLLNLLIAFMNVTTARVEGEGTLAWLHNHYLHVGKAENLTFAVPGLRQQYDRFPQYVYYAMSQKTVEGFGKNTKTHKREGQGELMYSHGPLGSIDFEVGGGGMEVWKLSRLKDNDVSAQPEAKRCSAQAGTSRLEPCTGNHQALLLPGGMAVVLDNLLVIPVRHPLLTTSQHDLEFSAKSEELLPGYYSVTWCMAPMNNSQLFDLVFEIETCSTECKLWAKTSKEEIGSISPKDPSNGLRLRLQRKLHLEHSSKIVVRLSVRLRSSPNSSSGQGSEFGAYSVELVRLGTEAPGEDFDYAFEAPGKALQRPNDMTFGQMAPIFATDVSDSGEYLAILSADHNNAYIHILDINIALQKSALNAVRAKHTISLQEGQFNNMQYVRIAISSNGEHIALYRQSFGNLAQEHTEHASLPFLFYAFQLNCVTAKDLQAASHSPTMVPIKGSTIRQLEAHFVGYGKFLARDGFQSGKKDFIERDHSAHGEYFVAINESRINVYDVGNGWKPLFGHNIGDLATMRSRTKQLQMLHQSISGPQFVWMEDAQNVSVWDLESGANTKYITVNNPDSSQQDIISYLAVSPGGKLLALAGKDWIRTYFMDSCIEICKTTIDNGTVLNIEFIDRDKSLLVTIGKPSMEQTSIIMDAMNLSSWQNHRREFPSSCYTSRRIARPSNGPQDGVMMAVNWNTLEVYDIPQPVPIDGLPVICQGTCTTNPHQELSYGPYRLVVDFDKRKNDDRHQKLARVCLWIVGSLHPIMTIIPEPWRFLDMNEVDSPIRASFLSPWPQFIITTSSGFQVWNLPQPDYDNQCELTLSWVMPRWRHTKINGCVENYVETIQETMVCSNGECATSTCIDKTTGKTRSERVNIPKSSWSTQSDTMHCINSFPVLASCYFHSSPAAQDAIIRYIVKHINHDPSEGAIKDSLMDMIAMSAKWKCCSDILGHILRSTDGKWIPRCTPTMKIRDGRRPDNPISLLLRNAEKDPYALSMAKQMMDYCIREAKSQCDPAFLHPVSACLLELVNHHPDIAIDVSQRSSFIPIRNKRFVIDRALVAPPLLTKALDWVVRRKRAIYEYRDPVFKLKSQLLAITPGDFTTHIEVTPEIISDPVNTERFEEKVYVAPYSLLWHYRDNTATLKYTNGIIGWIRAVVCWVINRIVDLALYIINWIMTMAPTRSNFICTVITVGCHAATMVVDTLNPLHKPTLRLNFRSRKYHNSPAIAALIRHKWDTVAWMAWTIRMAFQGLFLVSVILISGNQIYPVIKIWNLIVPICLSMALGLLGLYLEVLEFFEDYKLYISIVMYDNTNIIGDSRLLSIGVSVAYFHVVNELRVFRDVCNVTTNIWGIVYEIRFFILLFIFVLCAWTHTILHMLWGKSNDCLFVDESGNTISDRWNCPVRSTDFPYNPFAAFVSTFFIMGGQYDSISDYTKTSGDMNFLFLTISYYTLTVLVLLNILVSFMNVITARVQGEETLAWLDNLYHHVGKAENLTFTSPGFRQRYDRFPQYVYYTVSQKRIKELEESGNSLEGPQEKGAE